MKKEEEEEKLRRDRLLQEKQDALKAASLKAELTKAAESELVWDRRQDFTGNRSSDDVGEVQESCTKKTPEDCIKKTQENCTKKTQPLSVSGPETASFRSGSARTLIGGMVCDGSSYEEALNALKDRYGQEIDVVHSTLKNVFSCPPLKPFDAGSLERYHGAVHGACSTLRTMGFDGDLRSCEILRRVVSKLPMNLRKSWAEHSLSKERPTLLEFDDWLRVQVRVLLRCEASAPSSSTTRKNVEMFTTTTSTPPGGGSTCSLCRGTHGLWMCEEFKTRSPDERADVVASNRLCFSCLRPDHRSRDCRTARSCGIEGCTLRHSRLLHGSKRIRRLPTSSSAAAGPHPGAVTSEAVIASVRRETRDCSSVLLQVVPVRVHGVGGRYRETLALLDPGAQTSLCCSSILDELHLRGESQPLRLNSVEAVGRERKSQRVQLDISPLAKTEDTSMKICVPEAFSVHDINVQTPTVNKRTLGELQHLKDLKMPELVGAVEVLLGANVLEAVLQREARVGRPGEPVAIRTAFGWALTGSLTGLVPEHVCEVMFISTLSKEQTQLDLSDWWSTESFGTSVNQPVLTPDDRRAMEILEKTTKKMGDKYEVGMLWRDEEVRMPNNYTMSYSRLRSLENSLRKNPERVEAYSEVIQSYVQAGYAHKLTPQESETKDKRWILPHHAVLHPGKPKPRVVFDAAAQFHGTSLNSELLKGPDLLKILHGVLLRFREEPYALVDPDVSPDSRETRGSACSVVPVARA